MSDLDPYCKILLTRSVQLPNVRDFSVNKNPDLLERESTSYCVDRRGGRGFVLYNR